ncbi:hypothetical protein SAMN02745673_02034 [Marinactinospora thermotolerans DSM 45154]|uniref:Acyltransferase n=1 Tax=Marinactinospora thermotolerans DSM 45154 TaxID=1122192 RepID=A0A1T4PWU8_9ACTN|nr:acyltransferase domain-containing protein [Marinactinospora thermotolerans]SJZ95691.1 hypothetical protein SAMN02745673_02034 [Marinactinospora thermotolerans DSM 45154]
MDAETIAMRLGLGADVTPWLKEIAELPDTGLRLPAPQDAAEALQPFAPLPQDAAELAALWPDDSWPREALWLVERMYARIVADVDNDPWMWRDWPRLDHVDDARVRCAPVFAFAAAVPLLRARHARHGVPAEVTAATLADMGRHLAQTRTMLGRCGLETSTWMALHYRGGLYELGRLQYEPGRLGPIGAVTWYGPGQDEDLAPELRPGQPTLRLHIPQDGPLDPAAVQDSLRRARPFFAEHFDTDVAVATCTSWLLDPTLARYLPADSNILAFQRLFTLIDDDGADGDGDVFRFVFRHPRVDLDAVPQRTRLERAVVAHLRGGGHWRVRTGWLRLP